MSGEPIEAPIEPLTEHDLAELFLKACGVTRTDIELSGSGAQRLIEVAAAHQKRCVTPGRLSQEAAYLISDLAWPRITEPGELDTVYSASVLDRLMAINDSKIDWYAPELYEVSVEAFRNGEGIQELIAWIDEHRSHRCRGRAAAVILGAMTITSKDSLGSVQHRAGLLKGVMESLGFRVHAPCAAVGADRPVGEAAAEDIFQVSVADIIIALTDPPALGVGILLGEAARQGTPTLLIAEPATDITPIRTIVTGGAEVGICRELADESMLDWIESEVKRLLPDIESRHFRRIERRSRSAEFFAEYESSYQYARAQGAEIVVQDVLPYRVRLICTRPEIFATATIEELSAISVGIEATLYGAAGSALARHALELGVSESEGHGAGASGLSQPRPSSNDWTSTFTDLQPTLFGSDDREQQFEEDTFEWLSEDELYWSASVRQSLNLGDSDYRYMLQQARSCRRLESVSSGANRVDLGSGLAWLAFWNGSCRG